MYPKALFYAAALLAPSAASAVTVFRADLAPANSSGVGGFITFTLNDAQTSLAVDLEASGLANGAHFIHIHGLDTSGQVANGQPVNTAAPTPPVPPTGDLNGNGLVTTAEAKAAIGGVILSLAPHTAGTAGELVGVSSTNATGGLANGTLSFQATYNLLANIYEPGYGIADLLPLGYRVFDMHGGIVPSGFTADGAEEAAGAYDANLPIAAGKIALVSSTVPEPAAWTTMIAGFGLVGAALRGSRRRVALAM